AATLSSLATSRPSTSTSSGSAATWSASETAAGNPGRTESPSPGRRSARGRASENGPHMPLFALHPPMAAASRGGTRPQCSTQHELYRKGSLMPRIPRLRLRSASLASAVLLGAVAGVLVSAMPAQAAATTCGNAGSPGPGTYQSLVVPPGETCLLDGDVSIQ